MEQGMDPIVVDSIKADKLCCNISISGPVSSPSLPSRLGPPAKSRLVEASAMQGRLTVFADAFRA